MVPLIWLTVTVGGCHRRLAHSAVLSQAPARMGVGWGPAGLAPGLSPTTRLARHGPLGPPCSHFPRGLVEAMVCPGSGKEGWGQGAGWASEAMAVSGEGLMVWRACLGPAGPEISLFFSGSWEKKLRRQRLPRLWLGVCKGGSGARNWDRGRGTRLPLQLPPPQPSSLGAQHASVHLVQRC